MKAAFPSLKAVARRSPNVESGGVVYSRVLQAHRRHQLGETHGFGSGLQKRFSYDGPSRPNTERTNLRPCGQHKSSSEYIDKSHLVSLVQHNFVPPHAT